MSTEQEKSDAMMAAMRSAAETNRRLHMALARVMEEVQVNTDRAFYDHLTKKVARILKEEK